MLTQEAFDKIYKELDFEKIELKNFNFIDEVEEDGKTFKENFETILTETTNGLNSFYTKKIKEVENQIKELEKGKTEANSIKYENIVDDRYIKEFLDLGVISKGDINIEITNKNNEINKQKEEGNIKDLEILERYKNHLKESMNAITELNNFWNGYIKKMIDNKDKFEKKKKKIISDREKRYKKYKEECNKITEKAKDNINKIKKMVVFDENEYNEKMKKFEKIENKFKLETDLLYSELMNRKEVIKKYWKFSIKTIICGTLIGLTVPLTFGASAAVVVGSTLVSAGLSAVGEGVDYLAHSADGFSFKGITF